MNGTKAVAIFLLVLGILLLAHAGYSMLKSGGMISFPLQLPLGPKTGKTLTAQKTQIKTTSLVKTSKTNVITETTSIGTKSTESKPTESKPKTTSTKTASITSTTPAETKPKGTQTSEAVQPRYETGFFSHHWLKYRVRTEGKEYVITFENLGEETVNGRACYHQRIKVEGSQSGEMEEWYDKRTFECVKMVVSIPGMGRSEIPCPSGGTQTMTQTAQEGTNVSQAQVPVRGEQMNYVGEETIKVPAGTFNCFLFEGNGTKVWIAKQGLLVKWTSKDVEGVLLSYG